MSTFDVSDLHAVYGETLPSNVSVAVNKIQNILADRLSYVKEVKFHANFSPDEDTALALSADFVTKGLLVVASPDMPLTPQDVAWFPAQLNRGRTVFQIPEQKSIELNAPLSTLNASVGIYETRFVDDIGLDHVDRFLVVDSSPDNIVSPLHSQWMVGGVATIGQAYEQLTTRKVAGKTILEHARSQRQQLAEEILGGAASSIYNDEMNGLYSDQEHVYVSNALVKQEGHVLQRVSALGGLVEIQDPSRMFVPADQPVSLSAFKGWDDMSDRHLQRIYNDCSWDDQEAFNTQVLSASTWNKQLTKKATDLYGNSATATKWHMKKAKFSSQGVRDILPASVLMKLTPVKKPSFAPAAARTGNTLSIPIDPSYELFAKVMSTPSLWGNWKPFNDAVLDGNNYIKIPRELIERI